MAKEGRPLMVCGNEARVAGSATTKCERCGAALTITQGSAKDAIEQNCEIVCIECGTLEIALGGGIPLIGRNQRKEMTPEGVESMKRNWGAIDADERN